MLKSKIGSVQEVILPDFPDDDNTVTTTVTKSRRVSFGTNFVKEFIVGSAVSAQCMSEYEQASPSSDSSSANSSHSIVESDVLDRSTFVIHDVPKVPKSFIAVGQPPEIDVVDSRPKVPKFSSTICFSADSPTADMEFTEGCLTLAKSILDKKNKEMTLIIQAKPKEPKEPKDEEKPKEDETKYFNDDVEDESSFDMSMTRCLKATESKERELRRFESENKWEESKEIQMPLDMIIRHLDKDSSDMESELFGSEKSFNSLLNLDSFEKSNESEDLNFNESVDMSIDFQPNLSKEPQNADLQNVESERVEPQDAGPQNSEAEQVEPQDAVLQTAESQRVEPQNEMLQNAESQRVEPQNVESERLEPQDAVLQTAESQRVEPQNDMLQNAESQRVEPQNDMLQNAESQRVEPQNVESERLEPQNAVLQNAGPQNAESERLEPQDAVLQNAESQRVEPQNDMLQNAASQNDEPESAEPQNDEPENAESQNAGLQDAGLQNTGLQNAGLQNAGLQDAGLQNAEPQNLEPQNAASPVREMPKIVTCNAEPSLINVKVIENLKEQSKEPGCVWSLEDFLYPDNKPEGLLSFNCKLLESSVSICFNLQMSQEDSLYTCSVITNSSIKLNEEKQQRLPEYQHVVEFGFQQLNKYYEELRQRVETIRHIPYFLDQINSFMVKLNLLLQQILSILTLYPGSTLKGSSLSFRLFSFPIFFSCTVSVDLTNLYRLSKSSLSFENDFGSFDENKIRDIFQDCLKCENLLCEFVVQSTKYLIDLEKESGYVSKRGHIRLLPAEFKL